MKKNIQEWKVLLKEFETERLNSILELVLDRISLCESIYLTCGKNYGFSETFAEQAYKERQDLCQESSAIYSLLRERGEKL